MASCYGEGKFDADCDGLKDRERLSHLLPIRWESKRWTQLHKSNYSNLSTVIYYQHQQLQIFSFKFLQNEGEESSELVETDCKLEIDFFSSQEEREEAWELMNLEIQWGLSWPFQEIFPDFASFSKYFLSHSAFVVRVRNFQVIICMIDSLGLVSRRNLPSSGGKFPTVWLDVST